MKKSVALFAATLCAVTAAGIFDSGSLDPGREFTYRVTRPGEISYVCQFHPTMTGKIVVRP